MLILQRAAIGKRGMTTRRAMVVAIDGAMDGGDNRMRRSRYGGTTKSQNFKTYAFEPFQMESKRSRQTLEQNAFRQPRRRAAAGCTAAALNRLSGGESSETISELARRRPGRHVD